MALTKVSGDILKQPLNVIGNIGIGTTNPLQRLQIGSISVITSVGVTTTGIIGIGTNFITGISTSGISLGFFVTNANVSYGTTVTSIGISTVGISRTTTNVGIATTTFDFSPNVGFGTTGIIGISTNLITGINTTGISLGFIVANANVSSGTTVISIGISTIGISSTTSNVGIATTTFDFSFNVGTGSIGISTNLITGISTAGISLGLIVTNANVSYGTTVTSIGIGTIGISRITTNAAAIVNTIFTFTPDNTKVFVVTSNGDVGIGTDNPRARLDITGTTSSDMVRINQLGSGNALVVESGNIGIGTTNPTSNLQVVGSTELSELNLSGISSSISSTAVDVFVYDTRKDSDGGAWRKRTQNTSWYNETLNTATRGSRKDFPAVAVIVIEGTTTGSSKIKIYDGDDPDMPMWMIFNGSSHTAFTNSTITGEGSIVHPLALTSVFALNGTIAITSANYVLYLPNFISDVNIINVGEFSNYSGGFASYSLPISGRNSSGIYTRYSTQEILGAPLNDVAMTVLPNAPIDPSTGLPVPTIAVATNGGLSIIRDDGNVVDYTPTTSTWYPIFVSPYGTDKFIMTLSGTAGGYVVDIQSSDKTFNIVDVPSTNGWFHFRNAGSSKNLSTLSTQDEEVTRQAVAGSNGLSFIDINSSSYSNSLVSYATTSYNTGWMHGDIKGAFLSDTSTASVTGTELITNGTFDSNITGWTASTSTNTWSSGAMQITRSGGTGQATYQAFTTISGQRYVATATINSSGSRGDLYIINGTGWGGTQLGVTTGTFGQTRQITVYFTATSTTTTLAFAIDQNATSITVDNVSVRTEEPDRSVNNNGLAVYGTITKTAVATGSNLVGYSGFSASNYLEQPYNSALSFGTNDFSIMFWHYHTAGQPNINILRNTGGADGWGLYIGNNGQEVYIADGNFSVFNVFAGSSPGISLTSTWQQWVFVRKYNFGWIVYRNGVQVGTMSVLATSNFTEVAPLKINTTDPTSDRITLFRISQSVPSPSQILKIYNDEKVLFQENSQATLYGASDAVTALAYDDTTDLLSVGTSSGRSDFSGLKRINNTTTAVTTAISASNGLIAEQ